VLIELIVIAVVTAYLAIVVLGHVLLIAAIYKCLREDYMGGRGRKTASWHPRVIDGAKAQAEPSATKLATHA
jgi:hypothetical protein